MRGEPAAAEAGMTLHQPEAHRAFSQGSCPRIMGPWQCLAFLKGRRATDLLGRTFPSGVMLPLDKRCFPSLPLPDDSGAPPSLE